MNASTTDLAVSAPGTTRTNQFAEALILGLLFAVPALVCLHKADIADTDVWWHLHTGQIMLQSHSIPRTDPFTLFGAGKPWQPYSWLFELVIFKCFQAFGLAGILTYTTALVVAITAAMYRLIRRLQPDFSIAVLLTLVSSLSLMRLFTPRPWLCTILFFILQLDILMQARLRGKLRGLLLLPVLYLLWANIHIQFVDGLLVLGMAFAEAFFSRWWPAARTRLTPGITGAVFAACLLATLANPFGWRLYQVAHGLMTQSAVGNIAEMQALTFREPADYCMLFLALAAFAALGFSFFQKNAESHQPSLLFETVLLAVAALLSFHSARDMWFTVIVAAAILAWAISLGNPCFNKRPIYTIWVTVIVTASILFLGMRILRLNNSHLQTKLAQLMPAQAVKVIQEKNYSGPLYNTFDWGAYLTWKLHIPASIDGRTIIDGDNRLQRSYNTWNGAPDWASDPGLQQAALVVGPVRAPLTQLLRMDPQFHLVYEDSLAVVFTHTPQR